MMKVALRIAGVLALIGTPAAAADMAVKAPPRPPTPVQSWTGFYVGANFGLGAASGSVSDAFFSGANATPPVGPVDFISASGGGLIGGGQIGYNWQNGSLVLGVEADVDGDAESTTGCARPATPVDCVTSRVRGFGTVRGRLGFAADSWMLYGTGGFAWQSIAINETFSSAVLGGGPTPGAGPSTTRGGYAVGVGVERALWDHWIGGVEYLYINTGGQTESPFNFRVGGPSVVQTYNIQNNVGRVRLSYRF